MDGVFDPVATALSLVESERFLAATEVAIVEAREAGDPAMSELIRDYNRTSFAQTDFLSDLDDTPDRAIRVVEALAAQLADDDLQVIRRATAIHNAGNPGEAALLSMGQMMIVPDDIDAARVARAAEMHARSLRDGGGETHELARLLAEIAGRHGHYLRPVITSLVATILAREAVAD